MFYKNWPYWLKGGLYSALIGIILSEFFLFGARGGGFMNFGFIALMIVLSFLPTFLFFKIFSINIFDILNNMPNNDLSFYQFIAVVFACNAIIYFVIGAISGFFYGKIKNQNKKY